MNTTTILVLHPVAGLFPQLKDNREAWTQFIDSVRKHGQLDPIIVHEGKILDGRNRYEACIELNLVPRTIKFNSLGLQVAPHQYAFDRNFSRRDLTADQRAVIVAKFYKLTDAEVKCKRAEGGKRGGRGKKNLLMNSPEGFPKATTRQRIATEAKVSEHVAQQAMNVVGQIPRLPTTSSAANSS